MNASGIDYEAVFQALPSAVALFTTDLVYADVNEAFLSSMGRTRDQVVGRYLWAAFPDDPKDAAVSGMRKLQDSLRWVAATGSAMP
ncbi:PAS domain-containing protein [Streptomyces sp. NPDC059744]|uniref:PAS domain-containing protein n=1 Tax=Streptomyces sp. NPDC059744 TaxID=3346929 RepID=UPI00365DC63F